MTISERSREFEKLVANFATQNGLSEDEALLAFAASFVEYLGDKGIHAEKLILSAVKEAEKRFFDESSKLF